MLSETSISYQISELPQAWEQYRHIEETRTKYLAFFATVVVAATGFLVTLLKDALTVVDFRLTLAASITTAVVFAFSFVIWANIVRMGTVLAQYDVILETSRAAAHGSEHPLLRLWLVRARLPPEVQRGIFSVQSGGERIVLGTCWLLFGVQSTLAYFLFSDNCVAISPHVAVALSAIFMLVVLVYGHISRQKVRVHAKKAREGQPFEVPRFENPRKLWKR